MRIRKAWLLSGAILAAGLFMSANPAHASILWSTGFETASTTPTNGDRVANSVGDPAHSGDWSFKSTGNTSHGWVAPFNMTSQALPTLAIGETYGSFTFDFWVKPIAPANGTGLTYQIFITPQDIGGANTPQQIAYGNSTSTEEWQLVSANYTASMNAAYLVGAKSIGRIFLAATSTSYTSYDNIYIDDVSMNYTVVPEPATLSLLAISGLMLTARRRRA